VTLRHSKKKTILTRWPPDTNLDNFAYLSRDHYWNPVRMLSSNFFESEFLRLRYRDKTLFKYGVRPPYWICTSLYCIRKYILCC